MTKGLTDKQQSMLVSGKKSVRDGKKTASELLIGKVLECRAEASTAGPIDHDCFGPRSCWMAPGSTLFQTEDWLHGGQWPGRGENRDWARREVCFRDDARPASVLLNGHHVLCFALAPRQPRPVPAARENGCSFHPWYGPQGDAMDRK